jgi:hypothetical protein
MADLDETAIAQLAREMVMAIRNYKTIFADFGISEEDFYEISKSEYYRRVKDHYTLEWNSALSAADRVKLISASYAEQALPVMGKRMIDPKEPMAVALDTFKQFCKNAGIGDAKVSDQPVSDKFVITINLGADTKGKPVIEHYEKPVAIELNPLRPEK